MNEPIFDIPTISVVTPSYNQGCFLSETIESVISQAGDFRIDYIIVDGASTDNSVEIIQRFEQLLNNGTWPLKCRGIRYRWLSENDKGQTEAIAKGFRMSGGGILSWLNSDDTYLPGALQTVTGYLLENPDTGLLYGDSYYCTAAGEIISRDRTGNFDLGKLAYFNIICQPSAFFRRDAFTTVGGLDETLHFVMDFDLWIRIGRRFPCQYLPEFLSMYRLHEASKTICDESLFENSEEGLRVAIKHFDWAPLTRIYTSCSILCKTRLPAILAGNRIAVATAAIFCSLIRSLFLNRGFNRNDLKLFNRENFRKLFKNRIEIMTGRRP